MNTFLLAATLISQVLGGSTAVQGDLTIVYETLTTFVTVQGTSDSAVTLSSIVTSEVPRVEEVNPIMAAASHAHNLTKSAASSSAPKAKSSSSKLAKPTVSSLKLSNETKPRWNRTKSINGTNNATSGRNFTNSTNSTNSTGSAVLHQNRTSINLTARPTSSQSKPSSTRASSTSAGKTTSRSRNGVSRVIAANSGFVAAVGVIAAALI